MCFCAATVQFPNLGSLKFKSNLHSSFSITHLLLFQRARLEAPPQRAVKEAWRLSLLSPCRHHSLCPNWRPPFRCSTPSRTTAAASRPHAWFCRMHDAVAQAADRIDTAKVPSCSTCPVAMEILESQGSQVLQSFLGGREVAAYQGLVRLGARRKEKVKIRGARG